MPDGTASPLSPEPNLPTDVAVLQGMVRELLGAVRGQRRRIDQLEHRLDQLLKLHYGPRADKLHPDQGTLFAAAPDEPVELLPPPQPSAPPPEAPRELPPLSKPRGHGRRLLPENLRRETVVVDVPEAEKLAVGGAWTKIGEEVSEKLDYAPPALFVRRIVRPKYVVRFAAKPGEPKRPDELKIAALPPEALPKTKAAPGLVADVAVSKLVDHLPLYRLEKRYARHGLELTRSTLCGWLAEATEALAPLYALLQARVLAAKVVHTDDTPIPVQDASRDHCRTGRLWAYVSAGGVVYDATADRCRDGPRAFLHGFRGFLQCDAYAGYDELFRSPGRGVVEVGCWAHARRKFVEAEKASPAQAHEAVARIQALYAIEHAAKELDAPGRAALRQREAAPLLAALKDWLDRQHEVAIPKTPIAEALTYARNQWTALNVYVTDGDLAIDNNAAERAIKPFAIGRKNWLFFGSDQGGRTLATLASFTATCGLFKLNPWLWLRDTLTRLPLTPADRRGELLPTPPAAPQ